MAADFLIGGNILRSDKIEIILAVYTCHLILEPYNPMKVYFDETCSNQSKGITVCTYTTTIVDVISTEIALNNSSNI